MTCSSRRGRRDSLLTLRSSQLAGHVGVVAWSWWWSRGGGGGGHRRRVVVNAVLAVVVLL